jgi:hypothetical protein
MLLAISTYVTLDDIVPSAIRILLPILTELGSDLYEHETL